MSLFIDIHSLHTVPPSLINRDDTGAPKSAIFGGVSRQRVSSQSWKRAMRKYFDQHVDSAAVGARSRRLPESIAKRLEAHGVEQDEAIRRTEMLFKQAGIKTAVDKPKKKAEGEGEQEHSPYPRTGYLLFLSKHQIDNAVEALLASEGEKLPKSDAKKILDTEHSVDIALFGRMVADDAAFNVDAAVQVAHALGVHSSAPEFDYFTAVDDMAEEGEETGAGMIGTVQMMSSTLYRYASVNVDGLVANLDSEDVAIEAIQHFIEAFIQSLPTGKVTTFAHNTLPELVLVEVRRGRPVSLVSSFETPVEAQDGKDRRRVAAERLAQEATDVRTVYGLVPEASYVLGLSGLDESFSDLAETVTCPEMGEKVANDVRRILGDQ
ncbi:type I-E CRISPR-associated protein Cas7/Cse4/CasC [Corynebacterium sp. TAE3-ERU2]|uniref:type I-E CRISPR-associated protein Cas7/Cse4/CasC n=1 Tax=Corynebacterium sp. TAE3-ERU2 TaxID=2849497 RepID=UPI001C45BB85|nr:type I-E CRISPR-associated protein Cas7/Cse4/CasC [Corynebacterium sp. TAE3-ERU2]MBV7302352.1 type I-E CRISPR-associated protein Cas7/Cse4/CasC [Corynebacterium sp. TAE3-ERU2]